MIITPPQTYSALHPSLSDIAAYDLESDKYSKLADKNLATSTTLILTGHAV